jgi:beta-carotene 3-hydroxylase
VTGWTFLTVALVSSVLMEPITYVVHRWLMHGPAIGWHASHHSARRGRFERNDLFLLCFGAITVAVLVLGLSVPAFAVALPVGSGVTAYGFAYLVVHDLYTHRRLLRRRRELPVLERLAAAHRQHHRDGGEPYGFLLPLTAGGSRGSRAAPSPPAARASHLSV